MIELNKKYGCLTVLDMGEEFSSIKENYLSSLTTSDDALKQKLFEQISSLSVVKRKWLSWILFISDPDDYITQRYRLHYVRPQRVTVRKETSWCFDSKEEPHLHQEINQYIEKLKEKHYKCKCYHCGKIH